jgi:hypothetical protein
LAQKKTSGNSNFLMFSGGEKTLASIISAGGWEKLKFFGPLPVVAMGILSAAKPAKTEEIADRIGETQADFLGIWGKIEVFDIGGGGRHFFAEPAEYPPGPSAKAG